MAPCLPQHHCRDALALDAEARRSSPRSTHVPAMAGAPVFMAALGELVTHQAEVCKRHRGAPLLLPPP
jgi:hypothetical protein